MIHCQDIPMHLWEEAARTAVYLQDRLSHSALGFKTPEEMFSGKKPKVSHLKIFGCPVFVHIPKEKRTKLDLSGKKGIFVGYCEVSTAIPEIRPCIHSFPHSQTIVKHKRKTTCCEAHKKYMSSTDNS